MGNMFFLVNYIGYIRQWWSADQCQSVGHPLPVRRCSQKRTEKIVSAGKIVHWSLVQWKKFLLVRNTKKYEKHCSRYNGKLAHLKLVKYSLTLLNASNS